MSRRIATIAILFLLASILPICRAQTEQKQTITTANAYKAEATTAPTEPQQPSSSSSSSPSTNPTNSNDETIRQLLLNADSHRFGVPLGSLPSSAAKYSSIPPSTPQVRTSIHTYPQHASLQHSLAADSMMDLPTAITMLEDAAALGSSRAFNDLGEIYLYGEGSIQPNYTLAARYFNHSAGLGNPEAQHHLAIMSQLGLNTVGEPDEAAALVYDFFASMGDNPLAKLSLGYRHHFGLHVPKSCEAAVQYYLPVAEDVLAYSLRSPITPILELTRLSDDRARTVAPEEAEDAIQYYHHSAERGVVSSQVALGNLHYYGTRGFAQNPERAARYFKAAAAQGNPAAMAILGQMHIQGLGVEQNNDTAFEYLNKAAQKGNPIAQNGLGYLYLHGQGTRQDYKIALNWFKAASSQGNAEAQYNLGAMYFTGTGVEKSYSTAFQYLTAASAQGQVRAVYTLAQMYLNGLGTIKSCTLAVKLLKTVAERGEWAAVMNEAHRQFLKGRYEHAWMLYARAAEEGHEVAQANSAWMLDNNYGFTGVEKMITEREAARPSAASNHLSSSTSDSTDLTTDTASPPFRPNLRYVLAHRHWRMAAQQGHVDALRMLGDYAFDGLVTGQPDYVAAKKYYNQAAELRNAQSIFNLGYMHEHGLGVETHDYHLAKRYYDSCLAAEPDAYLPVKLALAKLYAKSYFHDWIYGSVEDETKATDESSSPSKSKASKSSPSSMTPLPGPISWFQHQLQSIGFNRFWDQIAQSDSIVDLFIKFEDVILAILCAALAVIVYYRSQR